jgi:hypothetical protein
MKHATNPLGEDTSVVQNVEGIDKRDVGANGMTDESRDRFPDGDIRAIHHLSANSGCGPVGMMHAYE